MKTYLFAFVVGILLFCLAENASLALSVPTITTTVSITSGPGAYNCTGIDSLGFPYVNVPGGSSHYGKFQFSDAKVNGSYPTRGVYFDFEIGIRGQDWAAGYTASSPSAVPDDNDAFAFSWDLSVEGDEANLEGSFTGTTYYTVKASSQAHSTDVTASNSANTQGTITLYPYG